MTSLILSIQVSLLSLALSDSETGYVRSGVIISNLSFAVRTTLESFDN